MAEHTDTFAVRPLVLLEDEPVETLNLDGLELKKFAGIISGAAIGTRGPFTVGVFGNWGTGKTSVLRLAKAQVDNSNFKNVVTVWFNAWQYEHDEHPIIPLVASIIDQLEDRLTQSRTTPGLVVEAVRSGWAKLTNVLRAVIYGVQAKAKFGAAGVGEVEIGLAAKEMISRYDEISQPSDPVVDRTLYYKAFDALRLVAPDPEEGSADTDVAKIAVFIDDLDRCLPERAVRLLESIKLVLTQKGFIYAMALDRPVVERFIDVTLRKSLDDPVLSSRGAKYLDKLIQLPIELPSHADRFAQYVAKTMERAVFIMDPDNRQLAHAIEPLMEIIGPAIEFNPRSFVRLVNNLIVDLRLLPPQPTENITEHVGLFTVTRLLRYRLSAEEFDYLCAPANTELREAMSKGEGDIFLDGRLEHSRARAESRGHRIEARLRKSFDEAPQLLELLKSKSGKRWLAEDKRRSTVIHFIRETRKESPSLPNDVARAAELFRFLSDKTRLHIIKLLASGERSGHSLCRALSLPQPTVAHHLGLLRIGNLIVSRRVGKKIVYGLNGQVGLEALRFAMEVER